MAKEENKIVDGLFGSRLKDASVAPPAGLWDSIAADLENDRLRRKVAMWRWVAAASIILVLGFGSWTLVHFSSTEHRNEERIASSAPMVGITPEAEDCAPLTTPPSRLAEVECAQPTPSTFATAQTLSSESMALVKNAVDRVRKEQFSTIRKAVSAPVILASLDSRSAGAIATPSTASTFSARNWSNIAMPSLQSDGMASKAELEEEFNSDRVKRRDREIVAWNAGDEPKRDKSKMKWALGGSFSPDVAFATQIPVGNAGARTTEPSLPDDPANAPRRLSEPVPTFSTGIRAALDLNDRMVIRSGALYTRRNGSETQLSSSFGRKETYANNFSVDYLEIPVSFQYNVVKGKVLDYYISSGVAGSMMLGYQQELQNSSGRISSKNVSDKTQAFSPAQASLLVSTGMQYKAFDRLSVNLEPGLRYGFLTSDYAFSREDPISLSLTSSLNFHF